MRKSKILFTGSKVSVTISRNGDLLSGVWLDLTAAADNDNVYSLLDNAEVEIGGQVIDKHYSEWMQMWVDLTHDGNKLTLLNRCRDTVAAAGTGSIPLLFWFCRNPGLALPLIALQYHEVKVSIQFEAQASLIRDVGAGADVAGLSPTFKLYVDQFKKLSQIT